MITVADAYDIFVKCRKSQILISGDTDTLIGKINLLKTGKYQRDPSYWARKFLDNFLFRLGKYINNDSTKVPKGSQGSSGSQGSQGLQCVNSTDCITSVHVSAIFKNQYFEVEENGFLYAYDIRSLTSNMPPFNAYTGNELDICNRSRLERKSYWLQKYYPDSIYFPKTDFEDLPTEQIITEVFSKINNHLYFDRILFDELDTDQIKELYFHLRELWDYRLGLSNIFKTELAPNGLFLASEQMDRCDSQDMARRILMKDVEILVSSCLGAIYFVKGMTYVSESAAQYYSFPSFDDNDDDDDV